jgi:hypothetical protein
MAEERVARAQEPCPSTTAAVHYFTQRPEQGERLVSMTIEIDVPQWLVHQRHNRILNSSADGWRDDHDPWPLAL